MSRLVWLLMPLALGRLKTGARNAKRRVAYLVVAGFLGLIALVFALVTITAAIAAKVGLLTALGIMTAAAALLAIAVLVAMRISDRRERARASPISRVPPSAYTSAMVRALASARRPTGKTTLGLGLLALGGLLMVLQGGDGNEDD